MKSERQHFRGTVTYIYKGISPETKDNGLDILSIETISQQENYIYEDGTIKPVKLKLTGVQLHDELEQYLKAYHKYDEKYKMITMTIIGDYSTRDNKYNFLTTGYYFITDNFKAINRFVEEHVIK